MLFNQQRIKGYIKQKNTIRHLYRITIKLFEICVRIVHTLFCLLVLLALFKKRKPIICILLSAIISTSIVTFGSVNMYTIHKTTDNIKTTKEITNT